MSANQAGSTSPTPAIDRRALAFQAEPRLRKASKDLYAEARTVADAPYAYMRAGNSFSSPGSMNAARESAAADARRLQAAALGFERAADYAAAGQLFANVAMRNSPKWVEFADLHRHFWEMS